MIFAPGGARTVYLNRHGGTYYGGYNDAATNHSSIVPGQSATLSALTAPTRIDRTTVTDLFSISPTSNPPE